MKTENIDEFTKVLTLLLKTYRVEVDKDLIEIWWMALSDMDVSAFRAAASAYIRTKRFAPTPADIRDLAGANKSAWPTPEEAWNMLPKTEDEGGWLCQEMATAMGACMDSLDAGDRIGSRMAFLEVYKREIQGNHGKPSWWLSEPTNMDHESRIHWKTSMLAQKPGVRPMLESANESQSIAELGLERTGNGLRRLQ